MKFGISWNTAFYGVDAEQMITVARHAEDRGFESFFVPEHIALYPGASFGAAEFPPGMEVADPIECLSFVAASTSRLLLGTGVLLLPYHHPVPLAKRLATLDTLSRGRLQLVTVGLGTLPGEAASVGVDFSSRGRRTDEALDVLRLLWAGDEAGVSHKGEFFSFDQLCIFPKPYKATGLPLHVGGSSRAAARRAGQRGDGYFPGGMLTPAERAAQWQLVRKSAADRRRDPETLEYTRWGNIGMSPAGVQARAAEGVTRLVVAPGSTDVDDQLQEITDAAERLGLAP